MKKRIQYLSVFCAILLLSGCNPDNSREISPSAGSAAVEPVQTAESASPPQTSATADPEPLSPDEVIPAAVQTPRIEGRRLSYTVENVYSGGEYFTVEISCIKLPDADSAPKLETTLIEGGVYGDFRLDLIENGEIIDTLKINVPRDDHFLIFESILQNLSYGCDIISNMKDFEDSGYPDLIQLDFHIVNEIEVPQYARYFAVSSRKLTEVPVYENGAEAAPYGTHLEPQSAGIMIQHIVASEYGNYTNIQYEYTFDPEEMKLTKKRVPHTGFGN